MNFRKVAIFATALFVLAVPAFADQVLYNQNFDGTGNAYSSQNDTNGFGLFAQVYDNFTINGGNYTITEVKWTGEYFNPPQQGPITGWTVNVYFDAAGQPGALQHTIHVNGTGGETFLGNFGGFPTYTYDVAGLSFGELSGVPYWLSVYPDLGFPPQWGWSSGTGGDGISYQDFFGARSQLAADMAFTVIGTQGGGVPEPGTLVMLGTGVLGLAGAIRRKLF